MYRNRNEDVMSGDWVMVMYIKKVKVKNVW